MVKFLAVLDRDLRQQVLGPSSCSTAFFDGLRRDYLMLHNVIKIRRFDAENLNLAASPKGERVLTPYVTDNKFSKLTEKGLIKGSGLTII